MIPRECKRLAEVDFPIAEVSRHAAREKSIRHGHPSTLHLWWARRPLASSRAVLMALLLPDPCDPHCPEAFKQQAREILREVRQPPANDADLRKALLWFIANFANWDNAADRTHLDVSRALVKAAHGEEPPLVVDPFAGGGSIPLEALRLGCEAFASDLNPVACVILKVMLEDIPRHGPELAEELRRVGGEIKRQAEQELADLYPADPDLPAPRRGTYFVYVLKCSDESFYIGQAEDVPRRMKQHETGRVSWTSKYLPVEAIHWEAFDSREAAVNREKKLKTGYGRKWLKREYEAGRLAARQAGGSTPIAYLWARTVRCEAPNCGAEIPLMRSFYLCKKPKRKRALRHRVERSEGEPPSVEFEVFEPKADREVRGGTVTRAKATCLCCGAVLPPERVRAQLAAQRGGADVIFDAEGRRTGGARMTAVVTLQPGQVGRHYRLSTDADYAAVRRSQARLADILGEWERIGKPGLCPVPNEPTPAGGGSGAGRAFSVQRYGMLQWDDLFTARQKMALVELGRLVADRHRDGKPDSASATNALLSIAVNKTSDLGNALAPWKPDAECPVHLFARQAIGMAWDFCESVPPCDASGSFLSAYQRSAGALDSVGEIGSKPGQIQSADAIEHPLPDQTAGVWFTDPPYYDAVPYADLSDFFLVWLKRALPGHLLLRDPFDPDNPLSPKTAEAVQDETKQADGRPKDREWFEETMAKAFAEGRRVLSEDGVGSVVFAHKTTEGWEALLSGVIRGGWTITGSWPIATEMGSRLRARDSAALATSIHLICRPRSEDAPVGDWADVLRELPVRVGDWMERLQSEGIRGADLVFACIGPALEIFSRYRAVETAEGDTVGLSEYLEKVWEVVGRAALQQVLGTAPASSADRQDAARSGALEEDARLTALFLWTLQSTDTVAENQEQADEVGEEAVAKVASKGFSLPFDVVRRFAQPMGIDLDTWKDRIIGQEKGVVRLLPVAERARELFGEDGASTAADWIESDPHADVQQTLFSDWQDSAPAIVREPRPRYGEASDEYPASTLGDTTLDRVHTAMLFQASGHANALRKLIGTEQDRGPDFLRLANALSALYPQGCNEKRLLDAMLLAVPR